MTTTFVLIDARPYAHTLTGEDFDCELCGSLASEHEWLGGSTCSNVSGRGVKGTLGQIMRREYKINNELVGL